jgi:uncharacterized protein YndB with AHSA1/START domain
MADRMVSAERVIPADAQRIFDLLANPAMHPVLDGSGSVKESRSGNPERLAQGAQFGMDMKMGVPYRMKNTVVEFDEGRRIAWRHVGKHTWRYELTPVDGGTLVKETWDWSPMGLAGKAVELAGFPKKNKASMEKTLDRLAEHLAAHPG